MVMQCGIVHKWSEVQSGGVGGEKYYVMFWPHGEDEEQSL